MTYSPELRAHLMGWAEEHASRSHGHFVTLDYRPDDPENFPGQDGVVVTGSPLLPNQVDFIATQARPSYPDMSILLDEQEKLTGIVSQIGELLQDGNNVVLLTGHPHFIDPAIAHTEVYSALGQAGYKPETATIVNAMLGYLARVFDGQPVPALKVLQWLENKTFLSVPRTASPRSQALSRELPEEIRYHNNEMLRALMLALGQGATLAAFAGSGTVDKPVAGGNPNTLVMGRMNTSTAKILMEEETYTAPVAIYSDKSGTVVFEICDDPRQIRSIEAGHACMALIADKLTQKVPDKKFVYKVA